VRSRNGISYLTARRFSAQNRLGSIQAIIIGRPFPAHGCGPHPVRAKHQLQGARFAYSPG
jgi:hypothetical protein